MKKGSKKQGPRLVTNFDPAAEKAAQEKAHEEALAEDRERSAEAAVEEPLPDNVVPLPTAAPVPAPTQVQTQAEPEKPVEAPVVLTGDELLARILGVLASMEAQQTNRTLRCIRLQYVELKSQVSTGEGPSRDNFRTTEHGGVQASAEQLVYFPEEGFVGVTTRSRVVNPDGTPRGGLKMLVPWENVKSAIPAGATIP